MDSFDEVVENKCRTVRIGIVVRTPVCGALGKGTFFVVKCEGRKVEGKKCCCCKVCRKRAIFVGAPNLTTKNVPFPNLVSAFA